MRTRISGICDVETEGNSVVMCSCANRTVARSTSHVARNIFLTCHELAGFLYKHSDEYHILLMSPRWHFLQHTKICTLSSVGGKEGGGAGP
jgi:hypothetical protein